MLTKEALNLYTRMVDGDHGSCVINKPGNRPRGSFTRAQPDQVELMVVLQNPGQPLEIEEEQQRYKNGEDLTRTIWTMTGDVLDGKYRSPTFSKMRRELAELLQIPEVQVYDHVLVTNLVHCTTPGNARPDNEAAQIGAAWLQEEMAVWRPKKVLAYGSWVRDQMRRYGLRCDAYLPHPAARGKWLKKGVRRAAVDDARLMLGL